MTLACCELVTASPAGQLGSVPRRAQPVCWGALSAGSLLGCRLPKLLIRLTQSYQGMPWSQRALVTPAQEVSLGSIPRHAQPVRWGALSAVSPLGCMNAQLLIWLGQSCQGMPHGPS